ncbi:MAG TPA: hypothetical protein PLS50_09380, partial [Candidatus Dojkabacteria bacterium]|nr:hypothetical protein [Candidatus Dojkabacteria bacterium]
NFIPINFIVKPALCSDPNLDIAANSGISIGFRYKLEELFSMKHNEGYTLKVNYFGEVYNETNVLIKDRSVIVNFSIFFKANSEPV